MQDNQDPIAQNINPSLSDVRTPMVARGKRRSFFSKLMRPIARKLVTSRLVRWTWGDASVADYYPILSEILPVDPASASEMLNGQYLFAAQTLETKGVSPFAVMPPSEEWLDELHSFVWIRHFSGASESQVSGFARTLVLDWISRYGGYDQTAWKPITTSRRIASWLKHLPILLEDANVKQRDAILGSMQKQAQSLRARMRLSMNDLERAHAQLALCGMAVSQRAGEDVLDLLLVQLIALLKAQITEDGIHLDRNPQTGFGILNELIPIRIALSERHTERLDAISEIIGAMIGGVKYFQHWDGELANFNGGCMVPIDELMAVLSHDDVGRTTDDDARHSGYQRLSAGKTIVIADAGVPPRGEASQACHAGAMSFEFSHGQDLVVCNAGPPPYKSESWAQSFRSSSAHSTLVMENTSTAKLVTKGARKGWIIFPGMMELLGRQEEPVGFKAQHTAYGSQFGYQHQRELSLDDGGHGLMGVDILRNINTKAPPKTHNFSIHFHLMPSTKIEQKTGDGGIELHMPSGNVWVFQCEGADVTIVPSERVSKLFGTQSTSQLLIAGTCTGECQIGWSFSLQLNTPGAKSPFYE